MVLNQTSPTKIYVEFADNAEVAKLQGLMSYKDRQVEQQIKMLKKNKIRYGADYVAKRMEALDKEVNKTMLMEDEGGIYVLSGLLSSVLKAFPSATYKNHVKYPEFKLIPWAKPPPYSPLPYQKVALEAMLANPHSHIEAATGCHAAGQEILMFDGSLKKVEDVVVGDKLIGPDSTPRTVLKLIRGRQEMVKIIPTKGEPFTVNLDHTLSLRLTCKNNKQKKEGKRRKDWKGVDRVDNISVREYLLKSKTYKHIAKLYKVKVDFKAAQQPVDPYILGVWLGDGSANTASITSIDQEIIDVWSKWITKNGDIVSIQSKPKTKAVTVYAAVNGIRSPHKGITQINSSRLLRSLGVINNKHIPKEYLISDKCQRLEILAGLIDTDGSLSGNCFEISQKNDKLAEDILFLARSLGFAAYNKKSLKKCQTGTEGTYNRIIISGDTDQIPTRLLRKKATKRMQVKNHLMLGFKTEILPKNEFFGFVIDKDNLYLMNDFTVSHNCGKSFIAILLAKQTGLPTIITTPSVSIAKQLYEEASLYFGKGKVGMLGGGKHDTGTHILIAVGKSVSMVKDPAQIAEFSMYQVFISDESHGLPATEFQFFANTVLGHCPYRWFLSATQERNDGKDLLLEGIIGKNVLTYTIQKAIEQGYLAKLSFMVFDVVSKSTHKSDNIVKMNQEHIYKNQDIAKAVADLSYGAVSAGMPTLILIDEHIQEQILKAYMKVPYAYACGGADNHQIVKDFNDGKIMCIVGTSAVSTGTNMKPLRFTLSWVANKAGTKVKQGAIGRSTRLDPKTNKTECQIIDFRITNIPMLKRHGSIRMEYYAEVGPVKVVDL